MKKLFFFLLVICNLSFFISSCHCKKKATSDASVSTQVARDFVKEGYVKATVINYEVDGCTFLLQLEDGKKLEPTSLLQDFKQDKLAVWIKFSPKKNAVSVCMAGQIVELSDIQLRK
ncbi:MAG TPA: hypothetical protein VII99_10405 [Bacteroidia bacterium]